VFLFVVVVATVSLPAVASARSHDSRTWVRPLPGPVLRAFQEPSNRFAAGHRGADFAARNSEGVRAAGGGVVEFAGAVAFSLHVVIRHANGWRTSYSYLSEVHVREGETVRAGQVLGQCCGPVDRSHALLSRTLHVGLRIGDDYVDPMLLFSPPDLSELVRLAPADGREWPAHRRSAVQMVLDTTGLSAVDGWGSSLLDGGAMLFDGFGDLLSAGAIQLPDLIRFLDEMDPMPIGPGAVFDFAQGVYNWIDQRDECDRDPPAPGSVMQPNRLMFVAGINSETNADNGTTNRFPADKIGYAAEDTEWFSYAADSGNYIAADTYAPIEQSAANLAEQLRVMQHEHPGRSVDLIAHSQGGVVVQTFLKLYYDPGDATLPPLGTVITLSSPHSGAPSATSADLVGRHPWGPLLLDQIPGLPPSDAASVQDLSELSDLNERLQATPLPEGLDVISIGAPYDYIVPETATHLDGAQHVTVDPDGIGSQHTTLTTDEATQLVVNNALLGRPAPCVSLRTALASAYFPERIAFIERTPGALSISPFSLAS
jgi:hypothetical protein